MMRRFTFSAVTAAISAVALTGFAQQRSSFTIAVFGDTQRIVQVDEVSAGEYDYQAVNRMDGFRDTVNWIRDNRVTENIQAVLQVGDFIDHNCDSTMDAACGGNTNGDDVCNRLQWGRILGLLFGPRSSFTFIDPTTCDNCDGTFSSDPNYDCDDTSSLQDNSLALGSIADFPVIVTQGNHDDHDNGTMSYGGSLGRDFYSGTPITLLSGVEHRYRAPNTYLGSFRDGNSVGSSGINHAFLIELGGRRTLVLTLGYEFVPSEDEGVWALGIIRARRHLPVIIIQHYMVYATTADLLASEDLVISQLDDEPNVRMIFGGHHYDSPAVGTMGSLGFGSPGGAFHMFINFQNVSAHGNGGGCVGRVIYDGSARTIDVDVRSPAGGIDGIYCDPASANRDWDQQLPGTIPFSFDPAPCNMFVTERTERTRRTLGCG
jgi:hypothetical protein